mmetsp:Transcript_70889/g.133497  ORF Transcript_70889/g.133497 Transcript_70889/m.133497 type:complete len:84 (-) Transcript_70889:252-503(-)
MPEGGERRGGCCSETGASALGIARPARVVSTVPAISGAVGVALSPVSGDGAGNEASTKVDNTGVAVVNVSDDDVDNNKGDTGM